MIRTLPDTLKCARRLATSTLLACVVAGCASSGNPKDPIEGFNRAMFAFNEGLDTAVIKPVARGYDAVLPTPVRTGVTNFFGNIEDLMIGANNLLQGKVPDGITDLGRFLVNSTIGVLGLIDWASDMGLEKHNEDFGQTFGRWGVGNGAYVVLPLFGSRTVRDTVGLIVDTKTDPINRMRRIASRNSLQALRIVNTRANLLPAEKVVEEAAIDKYSYMRDAYLQRRRSLIHDGNAPREPDADAEQIERPVTAEPGNAGKSLEPLTQAPGDDTVTESVN
jgi:phospholipid-binding lipoprotein MlaA